MALVDVPLEPVKKKKKAPKPATVVEPPKPQEPASGWGLGGLWNNAPSVAGIAETLKKNVQDQYQLKLKKEEEERKMKEKQDRIEAKR